MDVKKKRDQVVNSILSLVDDEVRKLRKMSRAKGDIPLRADQLDATGLTHLVSLCRGAAALIKSDPAHRASANAPGAGGFELLSDEELSRELQQQMRPEGDPN